MQILPVTAVSHKELCLVVTQYSMAHLSIHKVNIGPAVISGITPPLLPSPAQLLPSRFF